MFLKKVFNILDFEIIFVQKYVLFVCKLWVNIDVTVKSTFKKNSYLIKIRYTILIIHYLSYIEFTVKSILKICINQSTSGRKWNMCIF